MASSTKATTPAVTPHADAGATLVAWAGFMMQVPEGWRIVRAAGHADRGLLVFSDEERVRFQLQWSPSPKRRQDSAKETTRRLIKLKIAPRRPAPILKPLMLPHIGAGQLYERDKPEVDYFFAHTPADRMIEMLYHRGTAREDTFIRKSLLPSLQDQPRDAPQRWAFYDTSFIVPAGFVYRSAQLNLGDCRVQFLTGARELSGEMIMIRQIYPATLALSRQPLERWQDQWSEPLTQNYIVKRTRRFAKGDLVLDRIDTPRGPALMSRATLKPPLGFFYRKAARQARVYMVHDTQADRLIALHIAAHADRFDSLFTQVLQGLHWYSPHGPQA